MAQKMTWAVALLLVFNSPADALACSRARTWARGAALSEPLIIAPSFELPLSATPDLSLSMLPFRLEEALLPGETCKMHVTDESNLRVLQHALDKNNMCCGQLLLGKGGEASPVGTLLEVDLEGIVWSRAKGAKESEPQTGILVKVRCVGRIFLHDLILDNEGFLRASVALYADDDEDLDFEDFEDDFRALTAVLGTVDPATLARNEAAQAATRAVVASPEAQGVFPDEVVAAAWRLLVDLEGEVHETHSRVARLRSKLEEVQTNPDCSSCMLSQPEPLAASPEPLASARKEKLALHLPASERTSSLDDLVAGRRRTLLGSLLDEETADETATGDPFSTSEWLEATARPKPKRNPNAGLCDELGELWDVHTDDEAARTILSFAAAATLSSSIRMHALLSQSTTERLSASLYALRVAERRLAAELSLYRCLW